jgi:hypothetical protein
MRKTRLSALNNEYIIANQNLIKEQRYFSQQMYVIKYFVNY